LVSSFRTVPFTEDGEIRVNQSGSVALSAEEVRGPPQRKWLIKVALLTQGYEPYMDAPRFARHALSLWSSR
jgi:hypothetical protein